MVSKSEELGAMFLFSDEPEDYQKSRWPFVNYMKKKLKVGIWDKEKKRQALVQKSGHYRVKYSGIKNRRTRFLQDLYVTLIDLKWRYAIAILFNVYLASYFMFAVFWYWLMHNHGDFDHVNDPDWKSCVDGVHDFGNAFLFSIETQTTIGYGFAYPNTDCEGTLLLTFLQVTVGIFLENILLGFMFMKFAQPKRRGKTLMFSKHACVNHEDGVLCLQVRIGDMRQSHLVDAKVHGVLVKKRVTEEGKTYPLYLHSLEFEANDMGDKIVLMWPMVLSHKITESSPLWNIRPSDLTNEKYEIIIYAEGTLESTGEYCQARSSYLPCELLWGHRFDRIEQFDAGNGRWEVDFSGFNDVVYNSNIRHSAKELNDFKFRTKGKQEKPPRPPSPLKSVTYDLPPEYPAVLPPSEHENKKIHPHCPLIRQPISPTLIKISGYQDKIQFVCRRKETIPTTSGESVHENNATKIFMERSGDFKISSGYKIEGGPVKRMRDKGETDSCTLPPHGVHAQRSLRRHKSSHLNGPSSSQKVAVENRKTIFIANYEEKIYILYLQIHEKYITGTDVLTLYTNKPLYTVNNLYTKIIRSLKLGERSQHLKKFKYNIHFLNLLKDGDRNLTVIPLVMSNISNEISETLQNQMKSSNHINTILDQYPDNYNKSFSDVKTVNGTKVMTNTTIFKSKDDNSMTGMYMKEKIVDGKPKFLHAQMILHPKHPAMNNTV
ncbi:Hypothetical predicted protein [Mytilus galloprovincialis]|uniref:Uncharacterized protein n=1 Tax=Mytilus galloprovincialis TaxID=29158 RepID=A0A8B6BI40_MYTGA|nr:Hypothetical predicted protein [Mytilus galloprovincialis]